MTKQLLTALTLFIAAAASAQQIWTYSDCVSYAREHNISLRKSRLGEKTSECDLEEARAQWQPTLDFVTSHGFSNYPWGNVSKNSYSSSYGLSAGWTLWDGGKRENIIRQSEIRTQIDRLSTGDLLRSIETDLLQVYINILYAKEAIGIYEEAVRVSEAQALRAEQLVEAGKLSKVDHAQLKAQFEQDKYLLVNAQSTYDSRRMELKQLLELGIDGNITLADIEWTAAQVLEPLPSVDESYQMAISTDLKIQSLNLEKSSSELDVKIAEAGRLPKISLNAGVATGYNAPGNAFGTAMKQELNENIGLTLSIPIFDNKKAKTAIAKAKIAELDAQLDINQRLTELARIVENWYIDTRSAQSRYTAAESQLESARLSDELTNERFNLGYVNTVELMTAHNSYIEAQHTLLQAKYMAMLGHKMIEFYRNASVNLP